MLRGGNLLKASSSLDCNNQYCRKFGFTLAEVLITLGIIGIVSALTIPTLIANTQSQRFRSQFKKTLSTLNQSVKMSQVQNDLDFASMSEACTSNKMESVPPANMSICAIFNSTVKAHEYITFSSYSTSASTDYLANIERKTLQLYSGDRHGSTKTPLFSIIRLADGSFVGFRSSWTYCNGTLQMRGNSYFGPEYCIGFIDVNGAELPNKEVSCTDTTKNRESRVISSNGSSSTYSNNGCVVSNKGMGDVFPVEFINGSVLPGSTAAMTVLNSTK